MTLEVLEILELIQSVNSLINFIGTVFGGSEDTYDEDGNLLQSGSDGIAGLLQSANENTDEVEGYLSDIKEDVELYEGYLTEIKDNGTDIIEVLNDSADSIVVALDENNKVVLEKLETVEQYIGEYVEETSIRYEELAAKVNNMDLMFQYGFSIMLILLAVRFCQYLFSNVIFGRV